MFVNKFYVLRLIQSKCDNIYHINIYCIWYLLKKIIINNTTVKGLVDIYKKNIWFTLRGISRYRLRTAIFANFLVTQTNSLFSMAVSISRKKREFNKVQRSMMCILKFYVRILWINEKKKYTQLSKFISQHPIQLENRSYPKIIFSINNNLSK